MGEAAGGGGRGVTLCCLSEVFTESNLYVFHKMGAFCLFFQFILGKEVLWYYCAGRNCVNRLQRNHLAECKSATGTVN